MKPISKEMIIPKEEALFQLDKNGIWYNGDGKFQHPKIIRYFNASIRKDHRGYHLYQQREGFIEKVYFPYEDTALFVVDIKKGEKITLVLNTGESMILDPAWLFTCNDNLYAQTPDHRIKFAQMALVKIAPFIQEKDDRMGLSLDGVFHEIPEYHPR